MFQKTQPKPSAQELLKTDKITRAENPIADEVETVVGPSVNVEGDFASEGNIIVKGSVAGSVRTSRHLSVEQGAKIMANIKANSAKVAGEVRGNIKIKDSLELTATARIVGDIDAKVVVVEAGALICGRVNMPGIEGMEPKSARSLARISSAKKFDEPPQVTL